VRCARSGAGQSPFARYREIVAALMKGYRGERKPIASNWNDRVARKLLLKARLLLLLLARLRLVLALDAVFAAEPFRQSMSAQRFEQNGRKRSSAGLRQIGQRVFRMVTLSLASSLIALLRRDVEPVRRQGRVGYQGQRRSQALARPFQRGALRLQRAMTEALARAQAAAGRFRLRRAPRAAARSRP